MPRSMAVCSVFLVFSILPVGCQPRRPSSDIFDAIDRKDYRDTEVRAMINADPSVLSARDETSRTAMYMLARDGHTSLVQLCLDKGTDANQTGFEGHTALSAACHMGHLETARLLISRGADPNIASDDGETPLHQIIQASSESIELFKFLVKSGASLDVKTSEGLSLLEYCRDHRAAIEAPDYPGPEHAQKRWTAALLRIEAYLEKELGASRPPPNDQSSLSS